MDQMIGKVIDSYKILEVLGRGGMGVVYRAMDTTLDRDVALKMMDVLIASDPNFLKRFQSEAKALAKLQNPNIVGIFALRETEFGVCIVMEFVKGGTLADLLKHGNVLPIPRAINIFRQLLIALDHAHKAGVIHRDIKPGNVMLAEGDMVKVTDFGLAKIQKTTVSTMTMGTAGTLYYMSPEQIRGLGQVDHRGDIYSAGMALYESLAGRVPFKNDDSDFAIAQMIVEGRIPPPDKMNPGLPKELVRIVMRSLDKDPAKRYQSAAEMAHALSHFGSTMKPQEIQLSNAPTMIGPAGGVLAPPMRERAGVNIKLYGAIAAGLIVLAVTYFVAKPLVFPDEGTVSIRTVPAGARIAVDGEFLTKNPAEPISLSAGAHKFSATWEKGRLDTSIALQSGKVLSLVMTRHATEALAGASNPVETHPQVPVTTHPSEPVEEASHEPTHVRASEATLSLDAVPDGEVSVDGGPFRPAHPQLSVTLAAGTKRVVFRSTSGKVTKETSVDLRAGQEEGIRCYFQEPVTVTSSDGNNPMSAAIIVDGVTREEWTNGPPIVLSAGRHQLSVQKNGYVCVEGEKQVRIEPSFTGNERITVHFGLKPK
ncbi:MAG TPA: serine/threonine-protein kinase [Bacteroidota bacterium]|nr:serine/threonine-protein kinase [Bacteroidota bacterium]